MAQKCVAVENGAQVGHFLTPLLRGDCNAPVDTTITLAAAAPADGNAATITVPALAVGVKLPEGMWLGFVVPTTGVVIPVQLSATSVAGDTTLEVFNIPVTIPIGAVLTLPAPLGLRESASIERTSKTEDIDLLSQFWAYAETTGAAWAPKLDGLFSQTDPTYLNTGYCFRKNQKMWYKAQFPSPDPLVYSEGTSFAGEVIIESMSIDAKKGAVKGNISLKGNGELIETPPKLIAAIVP